MLWRPVFPRDDCRYVLLRCRLLQPTARHLATVFEGTQIFPSKEQHQELCQKLRGRYQYYGIRCNYKMLEVVMEHAKKAWRFWLSRRSHKSAIPWDKFKRLIELPYPCPESSMTSEEACRAAIVMRQSCAETLVTEEPDVLIGHVRICGGAGRVTAGSTRMQKPYRAR